jgi:hypothetical protein
MASGRGGRGAPDETVVMDGQTLRRVFDEATKSWVYRPVDETSGRTISKEDFESRRREEEAQRRASDPKHRAAEEKRWLEQQRFEIREKRAEVSRRMRREDHLASIRSGRAERRKPRRAVLASVPEPEALVELREEMRLATLADAQKKNPGRFAFIKTALELETSKYEVAVEAARRKAYAEERERRGVAGNDGGDDGASSSDDDEEQTRFVFRGSKEDLDDPDYRRGPMSTAPSVGRGAGPLEAGGAGREARPLEANGSRPGGGSEKDPEARRLGPPLDAKPRDRAGGAERGRGPGRHDGRGRGDPKRNAVPDGETASDRGGGGRAGGRGGGRRGGERKDDGGAPRGVPLPRMRPSPIAGESVERESVKRESVKRESAPTQDGGRGRGGRGGRGRARGGRGRGERGGRGGGEVPSA